MKVLVIGSGGREHALCWKIAQSPLVQKVYCAPGNGGIDAVATCVNLNIQDFHAIRDFVRQNAIDLTVVGPEAPLADGIVDVFKADGLAIFGPDMAAARLEGSKAFAKQQMYTANIPTARFGIFQDFEAARQYILQAPFDLVVKADGLAAGKGVLVTSDKNEALQALHAVMVAKEFGTAGATAVVEERLVGEEASFIVITDGEHIIPLATSQDHKRVFDHDQGPNTGGMGAYSPAPVIDDKLFRQVMDDILYPLIRGLASQGIIYKGVLYAGLMITDAGPQVLEFNCRLGDPETQPLLMRLKSDIVPLLMAVATGQSIKGMDLEWGGPSVCVVMAAGGYPGAYRKGTPISGIGAAEEIESVKVFHAGTKLSGGALVTAGGRVLGVTSQADDLTTALANVYRAVECITFEGAHFRHDIGRRAMERKQNR